MQYPKQIMSLTELVQLGFSRRELNKNVHAKGQTFAIKTTGGGKWIFDTAEYEKWRKQRTIVTVQKGGPPCESTMTT